MCSYIRFASLILSDHYLNKHNLNPAVVDYSLPEFFSFNAVLFLICLVCIIIAFIICVSIQ